MAARIMSRKNGGYYKRSCDFAQIKPVISNAAMKYEIFLFNTA